MGELIQIGAALCILVAFTLSQLGKVDQKSLGYLVLNAVGSGVLCEIAVAQRQWGFTMLEGVWCVVSLVSLLHSRVGSRSAPTRPRPGPVSRSQR
ncbi:putative membrane protein [Catenulispora sp. EB89]|uniref:CBU_0592 family membrane protein n=1 Tax=Catenulispora sp. EB89 TaxID=3156257 RepID=UPI0035136FCE